MYESGGQMHWTGHIVLLLLLFFIGASASTARWHGQLFAVPFFVYLGYLVWKSGRVGFRLIRQLLDKFR